MADQYLTISVVAADAAMTQRVAACHAQQVGTPDAEQWAWTNRFVWAATPSWAEKWDYAVANSNPDPGADPAVITDADILTRVQQLLGGTAPQVPGLAERVAAIEADLAQIRDALTD